MSLNWKTYFLLVRKKRIHLGGLFLLLVVLFLSTAPKQLFNDPISTVLLDRNGQLLSAKIASDGQWRFPAIDSIPSKFEKCILYFEDEYFYSHFGVNPISIYKAALQNIKAGRIVRGGSTITAQIVRLSRKGKPRTVYQKAIESIMAIQLECVSSKTDILKLYTSNAPFGGNVVGLDAAAWRYYGRSPALLSWSECATLAVLPNAPSLIYPGKSQKQLKAKRDRLLIKLFKKGVIDKTTCDLAMLEELPGRPQLLPRLTPHLLTRFVKEGKNGKKIRTTIDRSIQQKTTQVLEYHQKKLINNGVENAASLIVDVRNREVVAYVGNSKARSVNDGHAVDIISSVRSTGSTLKPILHAAALQDGMILPQTLLFDIPTYFKGFVPSNFDKRFSGACPADKALARSLNVPAVRLLQDFGVDRFYDLLKSLGMSSLTKPSKHYGLSLILGGAEISPWDLAKIYTNQARALLSYSNNHSLYEKEFNTEPTLLLTNGSVQREEYSEQNPLKASAIYLTFEALTKLQRPSEEGDWTSFLSSKKIAWKTGTSFGHRDAWAVGVTANYVVVTWAGNADGEGRPGLTGSRSASPILFDIFKHLPKTRWFDPPYDDMVQTKVCKHSGYKVGKHCEESRTIWVSQFGERSQTCPFHRTVHLNQEQTAQVNSSCYSVTAMVEKQWFVLPPTIAYYYKNQNPFYKELPMYKSGCVLDNRVLELIYPSENAQIFLPKGFRQKRQHVVFEATHRKFGVEVHWHLDDNYVETTQGIHKIELDCSVGEHWLTIVDEKGNQVQRKFVVLKS